MKLQYNEDDINKLFLEKNIQWDKFKEKKIKEREDELENNKEAIELEHQQTEINSKAPALIKQLDAIKGNLAQKVKNLQTDLDTAIDNLNKKFKKNVNQCKEIEISVEAVKKDVKNNIANIKEFENLDDDTKKRIKGNYKETMEYARKIKTFKKQLNNNEIPEPLKEIVYDGEKK